MELIIEMVAYRAAHVTDDLPWRCVLCEGLSAHPSERVCVHLQGEHGLEVEDLKLESDAWFLYPPKRKEVSN